MFAAPKAPMVPRGLLGRANRALKPGGRLILADYFVDIERKFNPHAVLMGMTMMASTVNGFPITNQQACGWMREAGFEGGSSHRAHRLPVLLYRDQKTGRDNDGAASTPSSRAGTSSR